MREEIWCDRVQKSEYSGKIFGVMFKPQDASAQNKVPLVIRGHGFNSNHNDNDYMARFAKKGIACFSLDFAGASFSSKSTGLSPMEYSVLTMEEDFESALEKVLEFDYIDKERIFILGESQGGLVAALVAPKIQDKIRALILIYPAFCIKDDAIKNYGSDVQKYPETLSLWGFSYGKKYYEDLFPIDIYAEIAKYEGPVKIIHGSEDFVVPISYSMRARKAYKNASLLTISEAGHGFAENAATMCFNAMVDFVKKH